MADLASRHADRAMRRGRRTLECLEPPPERSPDHAADEPQRRRELGRALRRRAGRRLALPRAGAAWTGTANARDLFGRLAVVEDRHTAQWEELFASAGRPLPPYRTCAAHAGCSPGSRRTFGPSSVLPLILAEEGREVQAYLGLARQSTNAQTHKAAVDIAADSAVHARELSEVMGREGEPWHVGGAGGLLRSIVYGFNDGLTANFGLVAGVVGASVSPHIVIITGHRRRDCRRAVDGIERLPGGQERGGSAGAPDRDGAPGDAADAGSRGRGARADLRGQGAAAGNARARRRKR